MPSLLKRVLIVVLSVLIAPAGVFLYHATILKALSGSHHGISGFLLAVISFFEVGGLQLVFSSVLIAGGVFGLAYGLMAGILGVYDLSGPAGWFELVIDLTWSLPNTLFGFVVGNLIYPFFGSPSREQSEDQGWIVYAPRGSSGFGTDVLQTLGTVNLGGTGAHERVHLFQARLLGPAYLILFGANYVVNSIIQLLWTATLGLVLWLTKVRETPYLRPAGNSAVQGFFGWIYQATLFELWAYATQ